MDNFKIISLFIEPVFKMNYINNLSIFKIEMNARILIYHNLTQKF